MEEARETKEPRERKPKSHTARDKKEDGGEQHHEGGQGRRGGRGGKFVPKGDRENRPAGEEVKEGEENQRPRRPPREKEVITLETEIPALPKKNEILKEPNDTELDDKLNALDRRITDLYNAKYNYVNQMREQSRENKHSKEGLALRDVVSAKIEERKKISAEFRLLNEEHAKLKADFDNFTSDQEKLREKMRGFKSKADLQKEINRLRDILSNESITLQEEKKLVREIEDLERAIPFADPYEGQSKRITEVKKRKDEVGKKKSELWQQLQVVNKEIDDAKAELDKISSTKEEKERDLGPQLNSKVDEFNSQINALKDDKKRIIKEHNQAWRKYEEQQDQIKRIEWMTRVKARLQREADYKKREEERQKREEEEAKKAAEASKNAGHPYQKELDICEQLLKYANSLVPAARAVQAKEEVKQEEKAREGEVFVPKKKQETFFFEGKNKKKNQPQRQQQDTQAKKESAQTLFNHKLDMLTYFDALKVPVPLFANDVERTIKLIEDKKNYFQSQSERPQEDAGAKANEGKKDSPSKKRDTFNPTNFEADFPSI
eukprot:TRINITY_DN1111_c0_g3_i1.p1 TRINITY_DN1111_c0_g3~~TRINITY_DN1111_c0_g3_i1.p1  ORF type:complete len:550 (+),score=282.20 TRINITY_DN1111_c0_g3_i1:39-1688(+)